MVEDSEMELNEAWNALDRDSHAILSTAKAILERGKTLTGNEIQEIITNLCEIQDLTETLSKDSGYYPDVKVLDEFLELAQKALKLYPDAPFSSILGVTVKKVSRYLSSISYEPPKYDEVEDKKKLKKIEPYKEKLSRFEEILREEAGKLLSKTRAELAKQREVKPVKEFSILELHKDQQETLESKVKECANLMILNYYREKFKI